ncbi:MAG: hypothetical protein V1781_01490 [Bacteroidota bacterium]
MLHFMFGIIKYWRKFFLFYLLSVCIFYSCKSPIPVYFDKSIGTKIQGFDTIIAGNYFFVENVLDKGIEEFNEKYTVKYDKIILRDTAISTEKNEKEISHEEIKELIGRGDSTRIKKEINCDSSISAFNELVIVKLSQKNTTLNYKDGIAKIAYDKVIVIGIDSTGVNYYDTLIRLNNNVLLTKYSGKYFLNLKTPFGWEIAQLEIWEKDFLSIRPFYFTNYNECAKTVAELTASTKNIYPDMKPILNKNKKVIGFKAMMVPKLLLNGFKKSENPMLMMRVK